MRIHVRKSVLVNKNTRNETVKFKAGKVPQRLGSFRNDEIEETDEKIEVSFVDSMTEMERKRFLNKWCHKNIDVVGK